MSNLNNIVRDIFSKKLSVAKEKIHNALASKVNDKLNEMKPEVAANLVQTEESVEMETEIDSDSDEESELSEVAPLKKRIDPTARRERAKSYRINKVKIKQKQKKYRKSAAGKRYQVRKKKMDKFGKTASGNRKSVIVNKRLR